MTPREKKITAGERPQTYALDLGSANKIMEDKNLSYETNRVMVINRRVRNTVSAALIAEISAGIVTACVCRDRII